MPVCPRITVARQQAIASLEAAEDFGCAAALHHADLTFEAADIGHSHGGQKDLGAVTEKHQREDIMRAKLADQLDNVGFDHVHTFAAHGGGAVNDQAEVDWRGAGCVQLGSAGQI